MDPIVGADQTPQPLPSDAGARRWWEDATTTEVLVSGVFEGGGAKGAAYAGALEAMRDEHWWFRAVAGASAGGITAALVAAGLTPEEIADWTPRALGTLAVVPTLGGLRRLARRTGYYGNEQLLELLESVLDAQCRRFGVPRDSGRVTFAQLYRATGIELYIVAADLTAAEQLVFNHITTPNCQVSSAVVASTSIPFAFESATLALVDRDDGLTYGHTVVDGGVWSNFPAFVFTDASFRKYIFETEHRPRGDLALGFVLEPRPEPVSSPLRDPRFAELDELIWPAEVREQRRKRPDLASRRGEGYRDRVDAPGYGRYPLPRRSWLRRLVVALDLGVFHFRGWLGAAVMGVTMVSMTAFLAMVVVPAVTPDDFGTWFQALSQEDVAVTDRLAAVAQLVGLLLLAFLILQVLEFFLLSGMALAGNTVVGRAIRRLGYGLGRTYVAGAMARPWAGLAEGEHIIRLPIPPKIKTLSFDLGSPHRSADLARLIDGARRTTHMRLEEIRSSHTGPLLGPGDLRAHRLDSLARALPTLRRRIAGAHAAFSRGLSASTAPDEGPFAPKAAKSVAEAAGRADGSVLVKEHLRVHAALVTVLELLLADIRLMPDEEEQVRRACVAAAESVSGAAQTQALLVRVFTASQGAANDTDAATSEHERLRTAWSTVASGLPWEWEAAREGAHVAHALDQVRAFEETLLLWLSVTADAG